MPSDFESFERSELAHANDRTGFEGFLFEQESRGVQIVGSQRDRIRNAVFFDGSDNGEATPNNIRLSTVDW